MSNPSRMRSRSFLDRLLPVAERCQTLGIPALALFPAIEPALKTPDGIEAANPAGLIPRVVKELKRQFPDLGVMTDVGVIHADETVVAAGAQCAQLLDSVGLTVKMNAPAGLLTHSKPTAKLLNGLVMTPGLHIRQTAEGRRSRIPARPLSRASRSRAAAA